MVYINYQPFIDGWYDQLNDAHSHGLTHIVYECIDAITDEDYE